MNKVKIAIFTISIIIFSLIGIKKLIYINQVKDLKNKEESILNESIRVLNECFDLENKNKRTLNKSIQFLLIINLNFITKIELLPYTLKMYLPLNIFV